MTTREINEKFAAMTKEVNKVKAYNTRLAKTLIEHDIKVPQTNWADEAEEEGE